MWLHAGELPAKCRKERRPPRLGKKEPNGILKFFNNFKCYLREKAWVAALGMFYLYNTAVVSSIFFPALRQQHGYADEGHSVNDRFLFTGTLGQSGVYAVQMSFHRPRCVSHAGKASGDQVEEV